MVDLHTTNKTSKIIYYLVSSPCSVLNTGQPLRPGLLLEPGQVRRHLRVPLQPGVGQGLVHCVPAARLTIMQHQGSQLHLAASRTTSSLWMTLTPASETEDQRRAGNMKSASRIWSTMETS